MLASPFKLPVQPRTLGWSLTLLVLAWSIGAGGARAQLIPLKTAPIATGSQFQRFPSETRGMGGLSIAVDDSLGDAFINPATVMRLEGTWAFSAPAYYTITGPDGSARTLSVGTVLEWDLWFGGVGLALQQLDPGSRSPSRAPVRPTFSTVAPPRTSALRPLRETSAENQYVTMLVGRQLSDRWALAGVAHWAGLNAMEGVDLLYPGNEGLRQEGHRLDVRVGLHREWDGQSFSALLLHDRIDMQHDVRYLDTRRIEGTNEYVQETRHERYFDRTNTWGLHMEYVRPLGTEGWRLGSVLTANRKDHPKIPNYDLMNIPRDPGTTWAYNAGVGFSRTVTNTRFGLDLLFEPIFSDTWANAQEHISVPGGGTIAPGERTIENDFTFANSTLRLGLEQNWSGGHIQLGAEVQTYRYWMTQTDHVEQTKRDQYEGWSEWTLTWGAGLDWTNVRFKYTGHLTLGTGRPGVASSLLRATADFSAAGDYIVAPRGPLALQSQRVFTHQLSVTIPIRGGEKK